VELIATAAVPIASVSINWRLEIIDSPGSGLYGLVISVDIESYTGSETLVSSLEEVLYSLAGDGSGGSS